MSKGVKNYKKIIFMGDFNFFDTTDKSSYFLENGFQEVASKNTYKSKEYDSRPDRIYFKKFKCVASYVYEDDFMSDHYCLMARFI
jgi:endonuclease/exonuclease/phosphatase family metal-dependent hydrolase